MIRVGLVGAGFMGGMHAACYQALKPLGVQVTAVADVRPEYAKKAAALSDAAVYASGAELIRLADVDVVDICLPTYMHAEAAVAAMRAGRDVFCEKPVCLTQEDMDLLQKTQAETGVRLMIGQVIRLWTEYAWLKQVKDEGVYGRVLSGVFQRLSSRPGWASDNWLHIPERSGGVAIDMHVHDVDFVRYLMGEPDSVQASAYRDADGFIEQIMALYTYGNDVAIAVEAGWDYPAAFPFTATYRVKFEKATVVLDHKGLFVYPNEGEPYQPELAAEFTMENDIGGNVSSLGGYYNELKYFVEGLQGKHGLDVAPLAEAIRSVQLCKKEVEIAGGLVRK